MITYARILLTIILMMMTITGAEAMSFGMKKGFRFEDYKTAEDAQAALLELHPVGSEVGALRKTLENIEFECSLRSLSNDLVNVLKHKGDFMLCSYFNKGVISNKEWRVIVDVNYPSSEKIKKLQVLSLNHLKFIP